MIDVQKEGKESVLPWENGILQSTREVTERGFQSVSIVSIQAFRLVSINLPSGSIFAFNPCFFALAQFPPFFLVSYLQKTARVAVLQLYVLLVWSRCVLTFDVVCAKLDSNKPIPSP